MQLTQQAIDLILAVVSQFDRERGVPHDYLDLEAKLKGLSWRRRDDGLLDVEIPGRAGSEQEHPVRQVVTLDAHAALVEAEQSWGEADAVDARPSAPGIP